MSRKAAARLTEWDLDRARGEPLEIMPEAEVADRGDVNSILIPDEVERRARAELPSDDGVGAETAEIEIGIAKYELTLAPNRTRSAAVSMCFVDIAAA